MRKEIGKLAPCPGEMAAPARTAKFRAAVVALYAAAEQATKAWEAAGGSAMLPMPKTSCAPDALARAARRGLLLAFTRTPLMAEDVAKLEPRNIDAVLAAGANGSDEYTEDAIVDALADLAAFARVAGFDEQSLLDRCTKYEEFRTPFGDTTND